MKEYLDNCLQKYFAEILNKQKFRKSDSQISGMGAFYEFKNKDLKFMIINDRGIIEVSLGSIYSKNLFDFGLVNSLFNEKFDLSNSNPKFGKNTLSKRLDLETIEELFQRKYDDLKFAFNNDNYGNTEIELSKLGNDRANLLFGKHT